MYEYNFRGPEANQLFYTDDLQPKTVCVREVVARIIRERSNLPPHQSLLVGLSGIDGSGKGYVSRQIEAELINNSVTVANINIDGWLNLPNERFSNVEPGEHFYDKAIRFEGLFRQLLLPLRNTRSLRLIADFAEETATRYRKHIYSFHDVDVVLVEGIFLFKRQYRRLFDLTVWIDCSFSKALERAVRRAQEGLPPEAMIRAYETIYFPAQLIHLKRDRPRESADLILDNDLVS